jgi:hypothetical protein
MESRIILDQSDPNFQWIGDHPENCWSVDLTGGPGGGPLYVYKPTGEAWVGSDAQWAAFPQGPDLSTNEIGGPSQCQFPSAQLAWWNVPTNLSVQDYNSQVLTLLLEADLDVYTWDWKTKWWESYFIQYQISEVTIDVIARAIKDYVIQTIYNQEHEQRYLFGFTVPQIGQYFGVTDRTALAIMRLVDHVVIPSDGIYLNAIKTRLQDGGDIRWGISQLAQHPEGSTYHGDIDLSQIDFQTAFLDFATGGYYSLASAGVQFTTDAINGDLSLSSLLAVVNVASNLGAAAAVIDVSNDTLGPEITTIIKGVLMAAAGLMASGLMAGNITQQSLASAVKFGVSTYGLVSAVTADTPTSLPPVGANGQPVVQVQQNGQMLVNAQGVPIDPYTGQPIGVVPLQATPDTSGVSVGTIATIAAAAYSMLR